MSCHWNRRAIIVFSKVLRCAKATCGGQVSQPFPLLGSGGLAASQLGPERVLQQVELSHVNGSASVIGAQNQPPNDVSQRFGSCAPSLIIGG